ncbi:hypothetical protein GCM10009558_108940 [Virgisporangium aurantiacum]
MVHEGHPGGGETDAPAGVFEQRNAGFALQRGELLRHGGRRVGVGRGDRGDGPQVGQVPEEPQPAYVEH